MLAIRVRYHHTFQLYCSGLCPRWFTNVNIDREVPSQIVALSLRCHVYELFPLFIEEPLEHTLMPYTADITDVYNFTKLLLCKVRIGTLSSIYQSMRQGTQKRVPTQHRCHPKKWLGWGYPLVLVHSIYQR